MDGRTSVNISRTKRTAEAVSGSDYCAQASPLSGPFTHPLTAEFRSLIGGALRFHGSAIAPLNSCYQHGGENVNEVKGESALEAWKKANGFRKPRSEGRTNLISSLQGTYYLFLLLLLSETTTTTLWKQHPTFPSGGINSDTVAQRSAVQCSSRHQSVKKKD